MKTFSKIAIILCFFFVSYSYAHCEKTKTKTLFIEMKSPQNDSIYCKYVLREMKLDTTFVFKTGNIDSVLSCRKDYDWKKISSDIKIAQQANVDTSAHSYLFFTEEYHKMRNYVNLLSLHDCQIGDTLFIMDNINTIEWTKSEISWKNSDINNYYITKTDDYYVIVIPSSSYDTNFYTNQQSLICNWDLYGLIQEYNSKKEIMQQYTYNFGENFVSRIILQENGKYKFDTLKFYDYPE